MRAVDVEDELYSERFLVRRPAARGPSPTAKGRPPVLLIDEVDRADDEFEAFLLEILSDYSVTVPELGTFRAETPPVVVITSNRTRDVHDALKRRCLYHWVEHPDFEREVAIVRAARARGGRARWPAQVAAAVEALRGLELYKPPGVAETIDWAQALAALGRTELDERAGRRPRSARSSSTARTRSACAAHGLGRAGARRGRRGGRDASRRRGAGRELERLAVAFARVLRGARARRAGRRDARVRRGARRGRARATATRVYWAGRATLVHRPEDIAAYDRAFAAFWVGATRPTRRRRRRRARR